MKELDHALVVTHLAYRSTLLEPTEGPYSSLYGALEREVKKTTLLGLPLIGYEKAVYYGDYPDGKKIFLPEFLGKWFILKFAVDLIVITLVAIWWNLENIGRKKLVIGIDPLSCLPLLILKPVFGFRLVYHCVDFNKKRFDNRFLQKAYELADEFASRGSDQTWVICQRLKDYKRQNYGIKAHYVPNSVSFDRSIYETGKSKRNGNTIVWTGGLMTQRQFGILFRVLAEIQKDVRKDIRYVLAPIGNHEVFDKYVKKYRLRHTKILRLNSRLEFQKVAVSCDAGIALYDERFGSTEFIEPMKVWDFLLCGLPFIVSSEPSISKPISESGVVYFMKPKNQIPSHRTLGRFLSKESLARKTPVCLALASRFDINKQVKRKLAML